VENIRYYHYILHGLRELDRPEAQMLAAVYDGPEGETARARLAAAPAAAPGPAGPDVATGGLPGAPPKTAAGPFALR
jgi:hypothetical protein